MFIFVAQEDSFAMEGSRNKVGEKTECQKKTDGEKRDDDELSQELTSVAQQTEAASGDSSSGNRASAICVEKEGNEDELPESTTATKSKKKRKRKKNKAVPAGSEGESTDHATISPLHEKTDPNGDPNLPSTSKLTSAGECENIDDLTDKESGSSSQKKKKKKKKKAKNVTGTKLPKGDDDHVTVQELESNDADPTEAEVSDYIAGDALTEQHDNHKESTPEEVTPQKMLGGMGNEIEEIKEENQSKKESGDGVVLVPRPLRSHLVMQS